MIPARRKLIAGTIGFATGSVIGMPSVASASPESVAKAVQVLIGQAKAVSTAIDLDIPEIAENGHRVNVSVSVVSPMSAVDYVESITLFAEENPNSQIAQFHFSPASGKAAVTTLMRLSKTQHVIAVAKLSNDRFTTASRMIKVTIGGCGADETEQPQ